jgi:hypothetical protein
MQGAFILNLIINGSILIANGEYSGIASLIGIVLTMMITMFIMLKAAFKFDIVRYIVAPSLILLYFFGRGLRYSSPSASVIMEIQSLGGILAVIMSLKFSSSWILTSLGFTIGFVFIPIYHQTHFWEHSSFFFISYLLIIYLIRALE